MMRKQTITRTAITCFLLLTEVTACSEYKSIPEIQSGQSGLSTATVLPDIPTIPANSLPAMVTVAAPAAAPGAGIVNPTIPALATPTKPQLATPTKPQLATPTRPQLATPAGGPAQPTSGEEIPTMPVLATPTMPELMLPTLPAADPAEQTSSSGVTPEPDFTPTVNMATVEPDVDAAASAPLEIAFPTALPEESLDWRPPLYPIPWALSKHDHFYFARPIAANVVNWPLWNYRYGGTNAAWEGVVHTGIDIDAPLGTPVRASAPGRVLWAGYGVYTGNNDSKDPYGLAVTLEHAFGFQGEKLYTIYAHMNEIYVKPNQMVNTGDILGIVGQTGATTGPHLHFEVRWKQNMFNSTLNPELWLAPPQGWGVLAGRVMNTSGSFFTSQDVTIMRSDKKQTWIVRTYGDKYVRSDPYYQENMVLSDLPAGNYIMNIEYEKVIFKYNFTINPGAVTYFRFKGTEGFYSDLPKDTSGFSPAPSE